MGIVRYALKDLRPVAATVRYQAERVRLRNKWSVKAAADRCGITRQHWYWVMSGCRVSPRTRELFKAFLKVVTFARGR